MNYEISVRDFCSLNYYWFIPHILVTNKKTSRGINRQANKMHPLPINLVKLLHQTLMIIHAIYRHMIQEKQMKIPEIYPDLHSWAKGHTFANHATKPTERAGLGVEVILRS